MRKIISILISVTMVNAAFGLEEPSVDGSKPDIVCQLKADDLLACFDSVIVKGSNVQLRFKEHGQRYIYADGESERSHKVSNYGETIVISEGETLVLHGRHFSISFIPMDERVWGVKGFWVVVKLDNRSRGARVLKKRGCLLLASHDDANAGRREASAAGGAEMKDIIYELSNGSLPATATAEECEKWWEENKSAYTLPGALPDGSQAGSGCDAALNQFDGEK